MFKTIIISLLIKLVTSVPPTNLNSDNFNEDIKNLKYTVKVLAIQLEKLNNIFLTTLEPQMSSYNSLLSSINSNIHNLQERAHVWDTFQLHVSAWNEQLATLDRKMDILSKGQEKLILLDTKVNSMISIDYKLDSISKKFGDIQDFLSNINFGNSNKENLFGEFATRGILSTVKSVEKKLDKLSLSHLQNVLIKTKSKDDRTKLTVKCHIPRVVEDLLNDISSKVDVMFDKLSRSEDNDYDTEYIESSGDLPLEIRQIKEKKISKKAIERIHPPYKQLSQKIDDLLNGVFLIKNTSNIILDNANTNFQKLLFECRIMDYHPNNLEEIISNRIINFNNNLDKILNSYFSEQRAHFESMFLKYLPKLHNCVSKNNFSNPLLNVSKTNSKLNISNNNNNNSFSVNKLSCEDLDNDSKSGIYIFMTNTSESNLNNRAYNKRYCEIRNDGLWTVIQRRDNYENLQNFTLNWYYYKMGFGDLKQDFWFGNDFISMLSFEKDLVLRIELEDFEDNCVWAEYSSFKLLSENDNYKLIVDGYSGNASDSLLSHNNSLFSTFDRKNDEAPDCCPCAVSYGGGWWFNKCFESNLNGVYHRDPYSNEYFRGIIWENWLGNYSLKKTQMMVKAKGKFYSSNNPVDNNNEFNNTYMEIADYEEP